MILLLYVGLMAALGAFLGFHAGALGVPQPILTGFVTVMSSLLFLPQLVRRVDAWRRSC